MRGHLLGGGDRDLLAFSAWDEAKIYPSPPHSVQVLGSLGVPLFLALATVANRTPLPSPKISRHFKSRLHLYAHRDSARQNVCTYVALLEQTICR